MIFIAFIKGLRPVFSPLRQPFPQPLPPRVPAPKVQFNRFALPSHVRTQPSRPVGGFLCHRGGYREAPGGKILDRGNPPQASCSRAGYSYSQIRREGRIHLPLPPRARVRSSPLRPGANVLLWTRFSRSSPRVFPPCLGVHHYVRGLPPNPPTLWLMAQDL